MKGGDRDVNRMSRFAGEQFLEKLVSSINPEGTKLFPILRYDPLLRKTATALVYSRDNGRLVPVAFADFANRRTHSHDCRTATENLFEDQTYTWNGVSCKLFVLLSDEYVATCQLAAVPIPTVMVQVGSAFQGIFSRVSIGGAKTKIGRPAMSQVPRC